MVNSAEDMPQTLGQGHSHSQLKCFPCSSHHMGVPTTRMIKHANGTHGNALQQSAAAPLQQQQVTPDSRVKRSCRCEACKTLEYHTHNNHSTHIHLAYSGLAGEDERIIHADECVQ